LTLELEVGTGGTELLLDEERNFLFKVGRNKVSETE
jgi:hypothetical protein